MIVRTNVELNEPSIQYLYQKLYVPVCLYLSLSVKILLSSSAPRTRDILVGRYMLELAKNWGVK